MSDSHDGPDGPNRRLLLDVRSLFEGGKDERIRVIVWAIAVLLVVALWQFFWRFEGILIVGLFVYYVTRPLFERIHSRIERRTTAVVVSLLLVAVPVLVLLAWTLVVAFQVLGDFLTPETQATVRALLDPYLDEAVIGADGQNVLDLVLADPVEFLETELGGIVTSTLELFVASLAVVFEVGLEAFIVLVIVFYLLRDDYRLAAWARRSFAAPGTIVERYLVSVDENLKNVFFGNILNALVTGLIAVVTYLLLNTVAPQIVRIPQPAFVGLLVGAASLVPVVGIKLVTWPIGGYLLLRAALEDPTVLWFPALFFVVSFVVVDYIPDQLLRPYVSGRSLHVGAVMLAYLFGPLLFGWYGIFMGPFLLVLVFEFGRVLLPWLFGAAEPSDPGGEGLDGTTVDTDAPGTRGVADGEPPSESSKDVGADSDVEPPEGAEHGSESDSNSEARSSDGHNARDAERDDTSG